MRVCVCYSDTQRSERSSEKRPLVCELEKYGFDFVSNHLQRVFVDLGLS